MKNIISKSLICLLLINISFGYSKNKVKTLGGEKISVVELDQFLKTQMDSLAIPGLSIAIINDAELVYHRTFGIANMQSFKKVDKKTIFEAGSLSKPMFAYLAMRIIEKGVIDLDTLLYKYLPNPDIEYDERYKQITARIVLCHSSGFPNWRTDKLYIKFDPGTGFLYSGEGYIYLTATIAHLLNKNAKSMEILFQNIVTKPLEIDHAYFVKNAYAEEHKACAHNINGVIDNSSPWWHENNFDTAGGLHTEALSYANFLVAVIEGKGIKTESLHEMLKEQIKVPKDVIEWTHFGYTGWGLGFAIKPSKYGINYCHTGNNLGFTSGCMINIDKKFGYVFFANNDQANEFNPRLEEFLTN